MKSYLEITLLPNPEVGINFLWSKVFQQIHLGLVEIQNEQNQVPIGVSFPEYIVGEKYSILGAKLRLFAQEEATLTRFDAPKWLDRLNDYVHCTGIRAVPDKLKGYAIYQREQPKTGRERLARRYAKRHDLDYETALNNAVELSIRTKEVNGATKALMRYSEMPHRAIATPFIRLKSLSSNNTFCLWIKKNSATQIAKGNFSTYGLSNKVTVPEF